MPDLPPNPLPCGCVARLDTDLPSGGTLTANATLTLAAYVAHCPLHAGAADAFRRGAEAMRERVEGWLRNEAEELKQCDDELQAEGKTLERAADAIAALPVPEDRPDA